MGSLVPRLFGSLVLSGLILGVAQPVRALAIAESAVDAFNLTVIPAAGTTDFLVPWELEVFAEALNSLGEYDADFDSGSGAIFIDASAAVTWADGDALATSLYLLPTASASSSAHIPGKITGFASSEGNALLGTAFQITGGTGSVVVDFSLDVTGSLSVSTDGFGVEATTQTLAALELDSVVVDADFRSLSVGPNQSGTDSIDLSLSGTRTLDFDTPYLLLIEADSESFAVNIPEPSAAILIALGLGGLAVRERSRKRYRGTARVSRI